MGCLFSETPTFFFSGTLAVGGGRIASRDRDDGVGIDEGRRLGGGHGSVIPVLARGTRTANHPALRGRRGGVVGRVTTPVVAPVGGRSPRGCLTRSSRFGLRWFVKGSLFQGSRRAGSRRHVGVALGVARRLKGQLLGWIRCRRWSWPRQGGVDFGLVTDCPWPDPVWTDCLISVGEAGHDGVGTPSADRATFLIRRGGVIDCAAPPVVAVADGQSQRG